eukprot:scaffold8899_cov21-Prasinocladus_malaysianus.AAC.1
MIVESRPEHKVGLQIGKANVKRMQGALTWPQVMVDLSDATAYVRFPQAMSRMFHPDRSSNGLGYIVLSPVAFMRPQLNRQAGMFVVQNDVTDPQATRGSLVPPVMRPLKVSICLGDISSCCT